MVERLSPLEASFLYLEEPATPMHVGGVLVLEAPPGGLDALAALVEARLALVPRYRQRVAEVPGHLADPVWVDDRDFDLAYHLRRSGLPRPGTEAQLLDLVSRLASRPLDRSRPLWEAYLIEGLSGGRVAVMTKTHPALVDGLSAIDIGQVLLDVDPEAVAPEPVDWQPGRAPGGAELVLQALDEYVRRPSTAVGVARAAASDLRSTAVRVGGVAGGLLRAVRSAVLPAPHSPLNAPVGRQRRVAVARAELEDLKRVRKAHGGTVNDVLLAVLTGALREWLLSRGEPVVGGTSVRALVPVSLQDDEPGSGNRVTSHLVDLPVGEPNPRVRLAHLGYAMRGIGGPGRSVTAESLIALTGFAPPTLHALGARAARGLSRRLFNLVITNVPGPQVPLYAAGGRMLEVFPVVPLARGQGLSIGMTSYNGTVFFGFNADRDSVGDVDVLADLVEQQVAELVEAAG
ncbi:wax ester/triacylglycerol synthase family O-acyltransferase [Blastococcus sp. TML/M2B]|uniref:WS/DGAT/MGAT family O-acyltransferase n=1 Tax=unclassified Blastococcus TaxID=2619396 RepID=UPI00190E18AA|nr:MULTISPECIES: wax ester/triacylglycerol synthase family O-acyltransferase [unclassified Blastococcus]MBN1093777.1 wax ester/triacylglycerol synthase family O-acyltransferase [Blastococcus sp. TML/M2B]MBN1096100.1 wax ester/triacylglycerol synthase family O-acyltransferase [Blastococcus sp. TML/C7B]